MSALIGIQDFLTLYNALSYCMCFLLKFDWLDTMQVVQKIELGSILASSCVA